MNVAVLGCGPSGLLAAHAATMRGHSVTVLSKKNRSPIYAAMFLHRDIPELTSPIPDTVIEVIKTGCREGYAENVYGDPSHPVSWDKFNEGNLRAWYLDKAYDRLWAQYEGRIVDVTIDRPRMKSIIRSFDLVISTIPRNLICKHPHKHRFNFQRIWVQHGPGERLIEDVNDHDLMYYNGYTPDGKYGLIGFPWYRYSQLRGYQSWEYSYEPPPPETTARRIDTGVKPLDNNCDCYPGVEFMGRFGKWEKQILTHHVWEDAYALLEV